MKRKKQPNENQTAALEQLGHLIKIADTCTNEGTHLNTETVSVLLRRVQRRFKSIVC